MKPRKPGYIVWILLSAYLFSACIHEYPHPTQGSGPGVGKDPTKVNAFIEVNYNLNWENLIYPVDFGSRADRESTHRFIIEVSQNRNPVCRDVVYLSDNEFRHARVNHRLSTALQPEDYEIVVWYDRQDSDGKYSFDVSSLFNIVLDNFSSIDADAMQCAFASDFLTLKEYKESEHPVSVVKELNMSIPGCRFEIIATDVQAFITEQKEALNQGDKFSVNLSFTNNAMTVFNSYSGTGIISEKPLEISGRMRLPFADYDELKIAEGFFFCEEESVVSAVLKVKNSALVSVSQTNQFEFRVKKGYLTIIRGDFLTHPVDGIFKIDTIWEDEIIFEI